MLSDSAGTNAFGAALTLQRVIQFFSSNATKLQFKTGASETI